MSVVRKNSDGLSRSLRELEEEVTCGVCQDYYNDPRILPCLHYYCKRCVVRLTLVEGFGRPFPCPECRKNVVIADDSDENLPSVFFINRLKGVFTRQKSVLAKVKKCGVCFTDSTDLRVVCKLCEILVCPRCAENHFHELDGVCEHGHSVLSGSEDVNADAVMKCLEHGEVLKVFCFECKKFICCECSLKDHKDHNSEFVGTAADSVREKLEVSLDPLKKAAVAFSDAEVILQRVHEEIQSQGVVLEEEVRASFAELHAILDERERELINETQKTTQQKMSSIDAQLKKANLTSSQVRNAIEYTESCMKEHSDSEIVEAHSEIAAQVKKAVKECDNLDFLDPVEDPNLKFQSSCGEVLRNVCQDKMKLTRSVIEVNFNGFNGKAVVNRMSEIPLSLSLLKDRPIRRKFALKAELKSRRCNSSIQCKVSSLGNSKYQVSFNPTSRGRHSLKITLEGQHGTQSMSTPVFVFASPKDLVHPVELCQTSKPCGIAVTSKGDVVVTECNSSVQIFDSRGAKTSILRGSQYGIKSFQGVAIDTQDNVYLPDSETNRMLIMNLARSEVRLFILKQIKGPGHVDVTVAGDRVLMTEYWNEGSISVYSQETMRPLRIIYGADSCILRCLSSDASGNIFVTTTFGVQMFDARGELVSYFGDENCGARHLMDPWCVQRFGPYVYVADRALNKILLFNKQGKFVTSLSGYGAFCFDQDGFMHICNFEKNCVNVL